ncbi:Phosphocarrier protein HPr /phosphoenolpyruvate--protein phosphotransferase /dihydroxyacetone kinase DhaM subunit [Nakamurella panacisegetis]|uniref:phosphoenolpyruvate--glycerone phosphotransferase n=1 Tax=Nakamurella panacisegetis TaxID=1090615 RepID=A0A1H0HGZ3_9ACTN|nr:Phosphocarrier protein HPr /phosphoenolpyruvate--protein phosphotransferase /dihydroxyacetone kinase DhaM subunit [Nakamurella panacisegetis]
MGLILVSHSADLARGSAELARQMAPSVVIAPAGGTDDGGIGTSFDLINEAIAKADTGDGAVLLYDLGSAVLTAEMAVEFLDPEAAARIRIVDAPLVEGAVSAAVTAEGGGDVDQVAASARSAGGPSGDGPEPDIEASVSARSAGDSVPAPDARDQVVKATVSVVNPLGLHARPVAALIRALTGWDVQVTIGRPGEPPVHLRAVLRVVGLALRGGDTVEVIASGPDAPDAAAIVTALISGGFGETVDRPRRLAPAAMGAAPARMGNAGTLRPVGGPAIVNSVLRATPGAPGLAMGPLVRLDRAPRQLTGDDAAAGGDHDPATERDRLDGAIAAAAQKLSAGNQFEVAHAILLTDPELRSAADAELDAGGSAAAAWWSSVGSTADALAADVDELVAARAVDVREAGAAVLAELGVVVDRIPSRLQGAVVFADDLGPGEVPVLLERGAVGVVLSRSSTTAHAVIVARGLGLPMILRAGDEIGRLPAGTELVLDGDRGTVRVSPDADQAADIRRRITEMTDAAQARTQAAHGPVHLADGRQILVVANIGSLADARAAVASGADGVGLLRTELLVLDRDTYPDEDVQTADLTAIFDVLGDRPIVVRVLDAGGDKPVTALDLDPQHNGFLGVRGLRYLLAHPDLLQTQLRAICRASVGHRVSVMAPMVSVAAEVVAFRAAVEQAVVSLGESGVPFQAPDEIGVMIEVPAAALAADEICAVSDFVSIGSNDLTSYTMAADRTETGVADLLDPSATAIQRLLDQLCGFAVASGTPVAVCGEIAGMPEHALGLVARGVHELSVAPVRIPLIKELLRTQG